MNDINYFMKITLEEAKKSDIDIPVGCVIEKEGVILSYTSNKKEKTNDITNHAEIIAIREASGKLNNSRLSSCNLYVTLEPCPMCAWAIINSRIKNVYFGAYNLNYGAFGSKINLNNISQNKVNVYGGIMEDECTKILDEYFKNMRN